ncbi:unnamed protein product [Ixodes pacificus]
MSFVQKAVRNFTRPSKTRRLCKKERSVRSPLQRAKKRAAISASPLFLFCFSYTKILRGLEKEGREKAAAIRECEAVITASRHWRLLLGCERERASLEMPGFVQSLLGMLEHATKPRILSSTRRHKGTGGTLCGAH